MVHSSVSAPTLAGNYTADVLRRYLRSGLMDRAGRLIGKVPHSAIASMLTDLPPGEARALMDLLLHPVRVEETLLKPSRDELPGLLELIPDAHLAQALERVSGPVGARVMTSLPPVRRRTIRGLLQERARVFVLQAPKIVGFREESQKGGARPALRLAPELSEASTWLRRRLAVAPIWSGSGFAGIGGSDPTGGNPGEGRSPDADGRGHAPSGSVVRGRSGVQEGSQKLSGEVAEAAGPAAPWDAASDPIEVGDRQAHPMPERERAGRAWARWLPWLSGSLLGIGSLRRALRFLDL